MYYLGNTYVSCFVFFLSVAKENVTLVKVKPTDSDYAPYCTEKSMLADPEASAFNSVNEAKQQEGKLPVLAVFKKVHYIYSHTHTRDVIC